MRIMSRGFAMFLAFSCAAARAETAKPADELNGCVERTRAENYILEHNFAELLRGESTDGKTQAVWTNGRQVLIVNYVRPAEGKMDELKTICVLSSFSQVTFDLSVIEKLVQSVEESLKAK